MTIDSYTLEWFFRIANIEENGKKKKRFLKTKVGCWSKMGYECYNDIQKRITDYLKYQKKYPSSKERITLILFWKILMI